MNLFSLLNLNLHYSNSDKIIIFYKDHILIAIDMHNADSKCNFIGVI